jgi:Ca2+-binding RTX toxin-like protein
MNLFQTLGALVLAGAALAVVPTAADAATPTCHGEAATLVGTPDRDRLVGTAGRVEVVARGGDDLVRGRGGEDLICGGGGADVLRGGPGDDRLHGQTEAYRNDRGGRYFEPDHLDGGPGDDLLDAGDDGRHVDFGSHGVLDFGRAAHGVVVDLAAGTATGQGADTLVVPRAPDCADSCFGVVVLGSGHDDQLSGTGDADHLVGDAGDDHLDGRGGADELRAESDSRPEPGAAADDDTLSGGPGRDLLVAWIGNDALYGDSDDDTVWSLGGGPSEVFGGQGDDELVISFPTSPTFMADGGEGHDAAQVLAPRRPGKGGRPEAATYDGSTGEAVANATVWGRIGTVEELFFAGGIDWTCEHTDGIEVEGCA